MVSHAALDRTRARHAAALDRGTSGHVPTPAELAEHLTGYPYSTLGSLADDARVLEPSAGAGALVRAILDAAPHVTVCAIEPAADRAAALAAWSNELPKPGPHRPARVDLHVEPFESYAAAHHADRFDAAIMNPPCAVSPGLLRLFLLISGRTRSSVA
jgi:methylase of polypeptide subunit release factors